METQILVTILTSAVVAFVTGVATFLIQERKLRTELRTEFMAEQVARSLLEDERWQKRSFDEIKKRLGGFDNDDLRKILVRAGAVRFQTHEGKELWGLLSRNRKDL